jgi:hypothetical protein
MTTCRNCGFSLNRDINQELHNSAVDPWQQLVGIESDITRVQVLLQELIQRRAHLKREINDRSAAVLRLPRELLEEVFVNFVEEGLPVHSNTLPRLHKSPLLLGRICSAWREVAWSTPRLWNLIPLDLTRKMDTVLVDQWFGRSGSAPVSIYALCKTSTPDPAIVAIMHAIARHSERWHTVELELPFFCFKPLEIIKNRLPNLQRLIINKEMWPPHPSLVASVEMFSVAPRLWAVSIQGFTHYSIQLPTSQLTKLSVESVYVQECMEMLRRCPQVIDCNFDGIVQLSHDPGHVLAARLTSFQLGVHNEYNEHFSSVFNALTIPAVREFSCHTTGCIFPYWSFISLMSRSSCSLHTLSLVGCTTSDTDLVSCLRAQPSLSELSLGYLTTSNTLLEMLTPGHWSNVGLGKLLPNLTHFEYTTELALDFSIVTNFLLSRWNTEEPDFSGNNSQDITRLKSAIFSTEENGKLDSRTLAQLNQLVTEGMHIEIMTADEDWP